MPEIRASRITSREKEAVLVEALLAVVPLVARDEYGVLGPVTRVVRMKGEFVGGSLRGCEEVLVLETESQMAIGERGSK